uniref:DDE-1 domain-containing protein n=1 Tax=Graphocephala atropunctata TaxID=36148 RepID=A0A1B6KXW8_9HEMI
MHRHQRLSLRTPRSTSLSRATAFNRVTVGEFFTNLKEVMTKHKFEPQSIFNIDETGVTTVHVPGRVITEKGSKEVSKVTLGERGTLVTVCCAVSAIGSSVPPFFVFPRVRVKDTMTKGAPPGSKAVAYPSGWMTGDNFEIYWDHFMKFVKCTKESPVLAILDNHDSHITPKGIQKCKDNGIILLTLPPHTSHKLQPLDRSVFRPFKNSVDQASDDFMVNNPGKPIAIYDIPEIVAKAFLKAFTPQNITNGFLKTGISPFNSDIFTDDDFMGKLCH